MCFPDASSSEKRKTVPALEIGDDGGLCGLFLSLISAIWCKNGAIGCPQALSPSLAQLGGRPEPEWVFNT